LKKIPSRAHQEFHVADALANLAGMNDIIGRLCPFILSRNLICVVTNPDFWMSRQTQYMPLNLTQKISMRLGFPCLSPDKKSKLKQTTLQKPAGSGFKPQ